MEIFALEVSLLRSDVSHHYLDGVKGNIYMGGITLAQFADQVLKSHPTVY